MTQLHPQNTDNFRVFNYWGEDLLRVIEQLNEMIWDEKHPDRDTFSISANGFYVIINFGDATLWHSEDDDREFNEQTGKYEPMLPFIQKRFRQYVEGLHSIHFKNQIDTTEQ